MNLPSYNIRQLLEAGVHFGHQTHRWNPLMDEYIYGSRNGIHILDLTQTLTMLDVALSEIHKLVAKVVVFYLSEQNGKHKTLSQMLHQSVLSII